MDHEKKLKFVHQMTKIGLDSIPHYDLGGAVSGAGIGGAIGGVGGILPGAMLGNSGLPQLGGNLGLNNNFQANGVNINPGTNAGQLGTAYANSQYGLNQQGQLANQVQPGIAQGLGAQSALSGQLAAQAAGHGPNPAQAALNQSTGQNVANQAALAAGQRGASSNAGLIASQAAQQGAGIQQQAVGQAATLQAQQQIAAQQAQQQLAAQQIGQGAAAIQGNNQAQQNEQGILQGANTSANNAAVSQQSGLNNANAQVAAGNQAAAGNLFGGVLSGAGAALAAFAEGGSVEKDKPLYDTSAYDKSSNQPAKQQANVPSGPRNLSSQEYNSLSPTAQGIVNSYKNQSSAGYADGGYVSPSPLVVNNPYPANGPQSAVGQWLNSSGSSQESLPQMQQPMAMAAQPGYSDQADALGSAVGGKFKKGSPLKTGSPIAGSGVGGGGDTFGSAGAGSAQTSIMNGAELVARGGSIKKMLPPMHGKNVALKSKGGKVKAADASQKAKVNHDDYDNDKVPAMLTQGEVVIDKDTLNDPGPVGHMARAVAQHINQRNSMDRGKKRV